MDGRPASELYDKLYSSPPPRPLVFGHRSRSFFHDAVNALTAAQSLGAGMLAVLRSASSLKQTHQCGQQLTCLSSRTIITGTEQA